MLCRNLGRAAASATQSLHLVRNTHNEVDAESPKDRGGSYPGVSTRTCLIKTGIAVSSFMRIFVGEAAFRSCKTLGKLSVVSHFMFSRMVEARFPSFSNSSAQ